MSNRFRRGGAALLTACIAAGLACAPKPPPKASPGALAEQYLEQGNALEAVRESERLVRANPKNAELRMVAARANQAQGDLDRALVHLEAAAELDPANGEAMIRIGEIEQQRQNMDPAYIAFRSAIRLAPDDVRAWKGMALTAEALGFEAEAEKAYARWAELEKAQGLTGNTD
jgi:tetratricopeptide (TPR) repeat protein